MTDALTTREQPDRSKINVSDPVEVHCWTKHLNVSKEKLQKAIDKVKNSAAAVRKEFGGVIEGVGEAPTLLICKPLPHRNILVQHPFLRYDRHRPDRAILCDCLECP